MQQEQSKVLSGVPEDIRQQYQEQEYRETKINQQAPKQESKQDGADKEDKRSFKIDKINKFRNKIKENDGLYKRKNHESFFKELSDLNLSKNIPEVVASLIECKLINTRFFLELTINLSQNYPDFFDQFLSGLGQHIELINSRLGNYENEHERSNKRRNIARLLGELYCIGVAKDSQKEKIIDLLKLLILIYKHVDGQLDQEMAENFKLNSKVGENFFKHFSFELFNTLTFQQRIHQLTYPTLEQFFSQQETTKKHQQIWQLADQFEGLVFKWMNAIYEKIKEVKLTNFTEDPKLAQAKEQFISLKVVYRNLLDYLGKYDPEHNQGQDQIFDLSRLGLDIFNDQLNDDPFENDEEKALYIQLPDLKEIVPKEVLRKEKEATQKQTLDEQGEAFFKKFRECMSIQIADDLSVEFCYINSKKNRKILVEEACFYRPNYILLVSYQCRTIATLSRQFREIDEECTKHLIEQYKNIRDQEAYSSDKKFRYLRYICELTKFKVIRQDIIMDIFQGFLEDLINQNVEYCVLIIENCGKFLMRSQQSYRKFKFQIEQLIKLRGSKPLSQQMDIALENALNTLNPNNPQQAIRPKKNPSRLQLYIKYLLFERLNESTIDMVKNEVLKLPHHLPECQHFLYKYLVKLSVRGRFSQIDPAATLLVALKQYYPVLVGQVVDHTLEEILTGLEENQFTQRQRRITMMKSLGELYNFSIISDDIVFSVLYQLIEFGHDYDIPKHLQDIIDPADDTIRISQVITLIFSMLKSFQKKLKNKVMRFMAYFLRYTMSKEYVTQDIEFSLLDLYDALEPLFKDIKSYKQAEQLCIIISEEESKSKSWTINYEVLIIDYLRQLTTKDQSIDIREQRRREEEAAEQEKLKKLESELDKQLNSLINDGKKFQQEKVQLSQQQKKGNASMNVVIKGNEKTKILVRAPGQEKVKQKNQQQNAQLAQYTKFV